MILVSTLSASSCSTPTSLLLFTFIVLRVSHSPSLFISFGGVFFCPLCLMRPLGYTSSSP